MTEHGAGLWEVAFDRVRADRECSERGGILQRTRGNVVTDICVEEAIARSVQGTVRRSTGKAGRSAARGGELVTGQGDRDPACGGRSILVEPGFDADHLRALLAVLEPQA